jgi:acetylornithine deacetylase
MSIDQKLFVDQLTQLINAPSVSCTQAHLDMSNRQVIDLLASWLEPLGFNIDIQVIEDVHGKNNKANLIATLGSGDGGLVFAGHSDTVPFDENRWQQDPFTLKIENNRAFGLGATDMKGFFPTVIAAIQPFLATPLKQPIIILATADEETSMGGAKALVNAHKPKARFAVVGEPTSMRPIRMHKGIAMEAIRIEGRAGHSSNPALGNNALDVMNDVINELKAYRTELQQKYQHAGFTIDIPTMNFGCIHGGDNPNRICGHCELEFDIRPLPGMKLDNLREDIDKKIAVIAREKNIIIERQSLFTGVNAFEQMANSPLIQAVESLTQQPADSVAFATEAPYFQELGMDVVVMGPGSIDQAHQPNEFIDLGDIENAVKTLQGLIQKFCVE